MASLIRASSVWLVACLLWPLWNCSRWWWRCVVELLTQVSVRHTPPRPRVRLWRVRWADILYVSCIQCQWGCAAGFWFKHIFWMQFGTWERFKCTAWNSLDTAYTTDALLFIWFGSGDVNGLHIVLHLTQV